MKRKRVQKSMMIAAGIILCAAGAVLIYFSLPYSPVKSKFDALSAQLIEQADHFEGVITEEDIASLPEPVKRYFRTCGYLGKPKTAYMVITYSNVSFSFGKDRAPIKIDYTQVSGVKKPDRVAYIDSAMYGVPFEGVDVIIGGTGSMQGMLGKVFTVFDYSGSEMDRSGLVTYLSECLFTPTAALESYIRWEPVDSSHAKATLTYGDIRVSGIFSFGDAGEMVSFETDDRFAAQDDGVSRQVKWSVRCGGYTDTDGIRRPTDFEAIWHYDDGDLIYFDGKGTITLYS
jgi:hypothetical protein